MKLIYNCNNVEHLEIKEKMDDLTLAFEKKESSDISEIVFEDGKEILAGIEAVTKRLEEIESELHQWYYCNC